MHEAEGTFARHKKRRTLRVLHKMVILVKNLRNTSKYSKPLSFAYAVIGRARAWRACWASLPLPVPLSGRISSPPLPGTLKPLRTRAHKRIQTHRHARGHARSRAHVYARSLSHNQLSPNPTRFAVSTAARHIFSCILLVCVFHHFVWLSAAWLPPR